MNRKKLKLYDATRLVGEDVIRVYKPFLFALNGNTRQAIFLTYLVNKNANHFGDDVSVTFSEIEDKLLIENADVIRCINSFGEKMWIRQFTITDENIEIILNLEKIARDVGGFNDRR